jgi:hypothetical protein
LDAAAASGKSSLRNDKRATEAKRGDELDDKANTSFDDVNETNFFEQHADLEKNTSLSHSLHFGF